MVAAVFMVSHNQFAGLCDGLFIVFFISRLSENILPVQCFTKLNCSQRTGASACSSFRPN